MLCKTPKAEHAPRVQPYAVVSHIRWNFTEGVEFRSAPASGFHIRFAAAYRKPSSLCVLASIKAIGIRDCQPLKL
ncbi:MAG: hypothetical protein LBJ35_00660 [Spirochaetaceae bacterium]|nr:hypothetical protein [Spirochaetaceae bacterium]